MFLITKCTPEKSKTSWLLFWLDDKLGTYRASTICLFLVCHDYSHCHVIICTKEYTSQTCGWCVSRKKIGGTKTYCCDECSLKIVSNINGSRNTLLKYMGEHLQHFKQ